MKIERRKEQIKKIAELVAKGKANIDCNIELCNDYNNDGEWFSVEKIDYDENGKLVCIVDCAEDSVWDLEDLEDFEIELIYDYLRF